MKRQVVELDLENVEGWLILGQIAGNAGNFKKAKEYFEKVVELDPENIEGLFQ
ncbi:MAG: tetratricopeptide repeat protein [Theionarchaea archaeon]|nr:tetratricopeptide repeat protein [Theionarchaea archaeon]